MYLEGKFELLKQFESDEVRKKQKITDARKNGENNW